MNKVCGLMLGMLCCGYAFAAHAETATPNVYGTPGLNVIPNARMDAAGTARLSLGTIDPYIHTQLGLQMSERIYVGLRQTGEISGLLSDPDYLMPGMDLKFRLFDEKKFRPEISLGLQSAFGHRRMAGEYLAFSKRYENWDFTAGFGWGRFGTQFNTPNPLDWTGSYLSKKRDLSGEDPNGPKDWFTGDTGFFTGVEYALPLQGLSVKADLSSDGWKSEKENGVSRPAPYSIGLSYQPLNGIDFGIAAIGTDSVVARISLKTMIEDWPFKSSQKEALLPISPPGDARYYTNRLGKIHVENHEASAKFALAPFRSSPHQMSQAWRIVAGAKEKQYPETLRIEPVYFGLKAPALTISKKDLESAIAGSGSAEEIWRNSSFDKKISSSGLNLKVFFPFFTLRENFSLSEDDAGLIHHTDILATITRQLGTYFLSETSLRYNLASSLDDIHKFRPRSLKPIRSDIDDYYEQKAAVSRMFFQGFKSFSTDWHVSASLGYLEELFAGYHGEI